MEVVEMDVFKPLRDFLGKSRKKERDSAEAALRLVQRRLLTCQRIGKIGNWEFDIAASQVWWSDQACEIYGLPPQSPESSVGTRDSMLAQVFAQDRERVELA